MSFDLNESDMNTKTEKILIVLKVLALLGGIGFSIECGSQITWLVFSLKNPQISNRFYSFRQDFYEILQYSALFFTYLMSFVIVIAALKATVWYWLFDLLLKLKLKSPFSLDVANRLERISYVLLGVWIISFTGKAYVKWLSKTSGVHLVDAGIGDEYLFISGVVYIISQIFKRGIEIQEENQLTV